MATVITPNIHQVSRTIRLVILVLVVLLLLVIVVMIIVEMIIFAIAAMVEVGIFVSIFAVQHIASFAVVPVIVPGSFASGWYVSTVIVK